IPARLFVTFGPDRLIFGSEWPVSTLATTHRGWIDVVDQLASGLSGLEQAALLGGTAARTSPLIKADDGKTLPLHDRPAVVKPSRHRRCSSGWCKRRCRRRRRRGRRGR